MQPEKNNKTVIIIGAGPAGLTAAYECLKKGMHPVVLEKTNIIGGIAATINYKGNRMDIGGHRFFSKSDIILDWWLSIFPLQKLSKNESAYARQYSQAQSNAPDPEKTDSTMLLRKRKSRIFYLSKLFDYPVQLNFKTLKYLGFWQTLQIGISYFKSLLFPIKPQKNLEDFFINGFGKKLYETFFKSYTEKVWGRSCREISAEWGAQRVKGVNILSVIKHFFKSLSSKTTDFRQKDTETSLIEQFLYPKLGPGQFWEEVVKLIRNQGGEVHLGLDAIKLNTDDYRIISIEATDSKTKATKAFKGDFFISSMPIRELVRGLQVDAPKDIKEISDGLLYRSFITVGILLKELKLKESDGTSAIKDNWIYVQEPFVKMGRIQIFNNWSPYMVKDKKLIFLGLEYFCDEGDDFWNLSNNEITKLAIEELSKMGIAEETDVIDTTIFRMPKTYPAYFGTYNRFGELQRYLDKFSNLFLIGRNGMHRYNNQDHSMLSAIYAVENIASGRQDKSNIWSVNIEKEYHEEKR